MAATPTQDSSQNDYFGHGQKNIPAGSSTPQLTQGPSQDNLNEFINDRFWISYEQAATKFDGNFLERNSNDMDIILLSSGLFSAVNTAFIVAMQPDPTIPLLWQIVQNTSFNTTISPLAASAAHPPNTIWFQSLAYVALSLNLLAAFGAVLGKQWLGHYKSHAGGEDRQEKLDCLETWNFRAVLLSFLMLLQISFFIFGIALSAFVWSHQGATAIVIMVLMAFGLFFYLFIVVASLKFPQCPFQTPTSVFLRFIWRRLRIRLSNAGYLSYNAGKLREEQKVSSVARSIRWILNHSTDSEAITSAAYLLPTIKSIHEVADVPAICSRLLQTFTACFHTDALLNHAARQRALACGRALHYLICKGTTGINIPLDFMRLDDWSNWRNLSLPWGLERCKDSFTKCITTRDQGHEEEARDALQFAIVNGCDGLLKPTDVALIWDGNFRWKDDQRITEEFNWIVEFLVYFRKAGTDFDAMGDALLALSAMRCLGSDAKRDEYLDAVIFAMDGDKPPRLRHAALRAIFDARVELVKIANQEEGDFREKLLRELAPALITAAEPIAPPQSDDETDAFFDLRRDKCYLQLIFTLAKQSDWRAHLGRARHVERCTSLLNPVIQNSISPVTPHSYYLAAILIRMKPTDNISELEWWKLLKEAWRAMYWNNLYLEEEAVEALPSIVTRTLELLKTRTARYDAESLVQPVSKVHRALSNIAVKSDVKRLQDALEKE